MEPRDAVPHAEDDLAAAIKTLQRGLAHDSPETIYGGYRELYRAGQAAIPYITRALSQSDWNTVTRHEEIRLLNGLMALLRDIDEAESDHVIGQLLDGGCSPAVAACLRSISRFRAADYRIYDVRGTRIFESREIETQQNVAGHIQTWLTGVPSEHLDGIERIYVITRKPSQDFSGKYMPILGTIEIVWPLPILGGRWLSPLLLLEKERTLYHEIGHHAHRHSFGHDPEQEREARRYAGRLMLKRHWYYRAVFLIMRILRFLKR
jgi:hypothetical protein